MILIWILQVVLNPGLLDWESSALTTTIIGKIYINVDVHILKTLNKICFIKQKQSKHSQRNLSFYELFPIFLLDKGLQWLFQTSFCSFGVQKKWSLVALDRWLSYTVTIVWELVWVDSAPVILDEWSSYRGGCLYRFDCSENVTVTTFNKTF